MGEGVKFRDDDADLNLDPSGVLNIEMHDKEAKTVRLKVYNYTHHTLEDFKIEFGPEKLPENSYDTDLPKFVMPNSSAYLRITLYGAKLFNVSLSELSIAIKYRKINRIG